MDLPQNPYCCSSQECILRVPEREAGTPGGSCDCLSECYDWPVNLERVEAGIRWLTSGLPKPVRSVKCDGCGGWATEAGLSAVGHFLYCHACNYY